MPLDKTGNFHNSTQRAMAADKRPGMPKSPAPTMGMDDPIGGGGPTHSPETISNLRDSFDQFLAEEAAEPGPHDPATIDALREAWGAFMDEEASET